MLTGWVVLAGAVAVAFSCLGACESRPQAPAPASRAETEAVERQPPAPAEAPAIEALAASRVNWNGGAYYLQGANLPWNNWGCDFGCGPSGGGASSPAARALIDSTFASAKASGLHVIRWWVFPGDPWQIGTDASGKPTGLDAGIYADFDAALALAAKYDLYFDFVLFSGPGAVRSSWLTDPAHRQALAQALGPLFAKYSGNPHVLAWEVFNEPEWDIWNHVVAEAPVQATVAAIAAAVHANSGAYVTVGSAMLDGLPMWLGQGLDFYQAHWYDPMSSGDWCARCTDYQSVVARYGLDAPLVLGELYAGAAVDARQRFQDFYDKGFAGAWAWSLLPGKTFDRLDVDLAAAKQFAQSHSDLGPSAAAAPPPRDLPVRMRMAAIAFDGP